MPSRPHLSSFEDDGEIPPPIVPEKSQNAEPNFARSAVGNGLRRLNPVLETPVGQQFHGVTVTQADIDQEHRIQRRSEMSRICEKHGNQAGARMWSSLADSAIRNRRPAVTTAIAKHEASFIGSAWFYSDEAHERSDT